MVGEGFDEIEDVRGSNTSGKGWSCPQSSRRKR